FMPIKLLLLIVVAVGLNSTATAEEECESPEISHFTFAWPIQDQCLSKPRGGTTKGEHVELLFEPREEWIALQEEGISAKERDRRAILAMQGGYKVNFDFLETIGFEPGYERDRPYQSWGTEFVYVLNDDEDFISLQHVLVMYIKREDDEVSEPMVMKHWRQDWTYEDSSILEYQISRDWQVRTLSRKEAKGKWTQAVFQVDDSPRYESIGEWRHNASFSSWKSATTRRPLPRREFSVRDDYEALEGFNSHVITRYGWVQVEENWKLNLDENGLPDEQMPYLSKEQGLARYQPTSNVDFEPGDEYMALAGLFWRDVREVWKDEFAKNSTLKLLASVDGQPLFMPLFSYANEVMEAGEYDAELGKAKAKEIIASFIAD
ncbi:MAG: DUF6607 family protein, partial [Pseudomonadota bacterium]